MSIISQMYSSASGGGMYTHVHPQQGGCDTHNNNNNNNTATTTPPAKPRRQRKKKTPKNNDSSSSFLGFKKRKLSDEQVNQLEKHFGCEHKLESERKDRLAAELGLDPRQVAVWFQNRRARWKNKKLEEEYSKLKSQHDAAVLEKCHLESQLLNMREQLSEAQKEIQRLSIADQQQLLHNQDQYFPAATSTNSPSSSMTTMEQPPSAMEPPPPHHDYSFVDHYDYAPDLMYYQDADDGYITAGAHPALMMELVTSGFYNL